MEAPKDTNNDHVATHQAVNDDGANKSSSSSSGRLTLTTTPEFPALKSSEPYKSFPILLSLRAPPLPSSSSSSRAPLDLVAVLDVSGSMQGNKLRLVKEAVGFVIDNLGPSDRLSIVTFSSDAKVVSPLRAMSDEGRVGSSRAVESLVTENMTNIVVGLKTGLNVLVRDATESNPVASIILLSDGQDNMNGSGKGFVNALIREVHVPPSVPIHTFGFGSDHDPAALHAVSEMSSGGTFSFVENIDAVKEAFAQCIGGLLSVVAQEVEVKVNSATPGEVKIESISSGRYKNKLDEVSGQAGVIEVTDLYADEVKKFLVYLNIGKATTRLLEVKYCYMDPLTKEAVTGEDHTVEILRPEEVTDEEKEVNMDVDRQRNQAMVVEGIAKAQAVAEKGDIVGAHKVLKETMDRLMGSASWLGRDPMSIGLENEVREVKDRMKTKERYEREGRGFMLVQNSAMGMQRATTKAFRRKCTARQSTGGAAPNYATPMMRQMVSKSRKKSKEDTAPEAAGNDAN